MSRLPEPTLSGPSPKVNVPIEDHDRAAVDASALLPLRVTDARREHEGWRHWPDQDPHDLLSISEVEAISMLDDRPASNLTELQGWARAGFEPQRAWKASDGAW